MRTSFKSQDARDIGNTVEVFAVTWDNTNGKKKRTGSCWTRSRKSAEATYARKEAEGKNPVLVNEWVGGFCF